MTAVLAALIFIGTDVDDLIVLSLLFANGRGHRWRIVAGQYLGIAALVAVSLLAALGLAPVPDRWVSLIGLVPLALGIRALVRREDDEPPVVARGVWSVAAITVANGADNISVYVPVFRTAGVSSTVLILIVFAALVGVWCALAAWLGSHRRVSAIIDRWGHWLVPAVFIGVGLVILSGLIWPR